MLISIGIVMLSGAAGGIINALVSDNGFIIPSEETVEGASIIRPGFAGNIFLGAVCAFISWGLYGVFNNTVIYGNATGFISADIPITISAVACTVLVGVGGARWLTNEVDKKLQSIAAKAAVASKTSLDDVRKIPIVMPARPFYVAKEMYHK